MDRKGLLKVTKSKGAWSVIRNGKIYRGESLDEARAKADADEGGEVINTDD